MDASTDIDLDIVVVDAVSASKIAHNRDDIGRDTDSQVFARLRLAKATSGIEVFSQQTFGAAEIPSEDNVADELVNFISNEQTMHAARLRARLVRSFGVGDPDLVDLRATINRCRLNTKNCQIVMTGSKRFRWTRC